METEIVCLANTFGGTILFGVDKKKENHGISRNDFTELEQLIRILKRRYKSVTLLSIETEQCRNAVLQVEKTEKEMHFNGIAYIRRQTEILPGATENHSMVLHKFIESVHNSPPCPRDTRVMMYLDYTPANSFRIIPAGTALFRAEVITDKPKPGEKTDFYGYGTEEAPMGSHLCCSGNAFTALAQAQGSPGDALNLERINVNSEMKCLDLTMQSVSSEMKVPKRVLFGSLSMLFAKCVDESFKKDNLRAIRTIEEYVKILGYEGIIYHSLFSPEPEDENMSAGYNAIIFYTDKWSKVRSNTVRVEPNGDYKQIDSDERRVCFDRFIRF